MYGQVCYFFRATRNFAEILHGEGEGIISVLANADRELIKNNAKGKMGGIVQKSGDLGWVLGKAKVNQIGGKKWPQQSVLRGDQEQKKLDLPVLVSKRFIFSLPYSGAY